MLYHLQERENENKKKSGMKNEKSQGCRTILFDGFGI